MAALHGPLYGLPEVHPAWRAAIAVNVVSMRSASGTHATVTVLPDTSTGP